MLEPALEVCKNMTACRNKASQMRERILFAILRMREYMRSHGRCLATDSHKYAKEAMNNCNSNEVHLLPSRTSGSTRKSFAHEVLEISCLYDKIGVLFEATV